MTSRVILLALVAAGAVCSATAAEFFLAPSGDDSHPGTRALPWRTLDRANRSLQAGDTVALLAGTYAGVIRPGNNGADAGRPIVYRSEPRRAAVLVGEPESPHVVQLDARRHIVLDGLEVRPAAGAFGRIVGSEDITVRDCHLEGATRLYVSLEVTDTHRSRFLDNTFTRGLVRTSGGRIHGDLVVFTDCSLLLIEGNDFSKSGHVPLSITAQAAGRGRGVVVRGNCFHNSWGRGFSFHNLERALIEENLLTDSFNGATSADAASKLFLIDGIFRHNLVFENWEEPLASESYHTPAAKNYPMWELRDSRIYHNTFANNPTYVWRLGSYRGGEPVRGNVFFNNLFFRNGHTGGFETLIAPLPGFAADNALHHNLFFGDEGHPAIVRLRQERHPATELEARLGARARNNLGADPRLVDPANRWFALAADSPARAAGRPLARAVGAGVGRELPVSDARGFFDGFDVPDQRGDLIVVGRDKQPARVVHADLARHTLSLDRDVRWVTEDPVSLPYAGTAPDIGALPAGEAPGLRVRVRAVPARAVPGAPFIFTAETTGARGSVELAWDLGDGTTAADRAVSHAFRCTGNQVIRVRARDASGATARGLAIVTVTPPLDPTAPLLAFDFEESSFESWGWQWDRGPTRDADWYGAVPHEEGGGQCLLIRATASRGSRLSCCLRLHEWDLERHPRIRFSYRIPPGTPVGLHVRPWPAAGRPARLGLAGSPSDPVSRQTGAVRLIDDGRWHTVTLDARLARQTWPELRQAHALEFHTDAPVREGLSFRIDDLAILP